MTVGGCVISTALLFPTPTMVISSAGRNLVLGGLRSLPAVEMTSHYDPGNKDFGDEFHASGWLEAMHDFQQSA